MTQFREMELDTLVRKEEQANQQPRRKKIYKKQSTPHAKHVIQEILEPKADNKNVETKYIERVSVSSSDMVVGKLSWNICDIIGLGSCGTVVYKGKYEGVLDCAIKVLVKAHWNSYDTEINNLIHLCFHHENLPKSIVRYFGKEEDEIQGYIALELCKYTLQEYLIINEDLDSAKTLKGMHQIAKAMRFLHQENIVHNDINPHNVLISKAGIWKLSDMGMSKKLKDGQASYTFSNEVPTGAGGWYANEILVNGRKTNKVDVFAFGCLLYYCMFRTNPFGEEYYCYIAIKEKEKPELSPMLTELEHELISQMVSHEPVNRPNILVICDHPIFWKWSKKLKYIHQTSNKIDSMRNKLVLAQIESLLNRSSNWKSSMRKELWEYINKHRKYDEMKVVHLLRAIRNIREHWHIASRNRLLSSTFGNNLEGVWVYFNSAFPHLFYDVWKACQSMNI
eukprot:TRINITY_DN5923_c0_g1_i1.p1 TRINITY_DN5923_c0_g1~~TRINITY_DN5923_c0_g1_i1.p1  ORF type:complete len:514 (-),score=88.13 TRINITY_DN5923_c0_g1_i1:795-2147(-)